MRYSPLRLCLILKVASESRSEEIHQSLRLDGLSFFASLKAHDIRRKSMNPTQYHDRIERATQKLAQLQARELLASRRREFKAKQQAKRDEAKRRARVAELAFLAGAQSLDDAELVGVLRQHIQNRNSQVRQHVSEIGAACMPRSSPNSDTRHTQ